MQTPETLHPRPANDILLVANWKSDVGYAWWLMENFWVQISQVFAQGAGGCHLMYPEITQVPDAVAHARIVLHELDDRHVSPRQLLRLFRLIRGHRIKFIYLTDRPYFAWQYALLRLFGVRKIAVHDHTPGERAAARGIARLIKRVKHALPLFTADAYIATTPYVRNRHLAAGCIPPRKSYLVANGIVPIGRDPALASYCHDLFEIPPGACIVFTSGRASPIKQIDFIIRCAAKLIKDEGHDVYFVYCGDGPQLAALMELATACGLQRRFIFAGVRSDVRLLVQSCHIGIQASKGEVGYSLSILEYMSGGLATVVSDHPSVCGAIQDGDTGLVYRADELASACAALRRLILDTQLRERLGRQAMQAVEADYNLANTNAQLRSVIREICAL